MRTVPVRILLSAALVVSAITCSACSSSGDDASPSGSSGAATTNACEQDTRKDIYTAGLSKQTASAYSLKIMDATPAPPAKLTNAMTVQLLDTTGKPVDGASLSVVPFMPDHGHGSAVKPAVTPKGGGVYDIANLYYPMPGLWRITVTIQVPNVAPQDVAFSFCIDG